MNLAQTILDAGREDPDHIAIKLDDTELSYALLDGATARMVGLLRAHGVKPGDRVGIMLPNVPYFPIAYYGILRAGAIVVPMNVLLKQREVGNYLTDPEARLLIAWAELAEAAQPGAARRAPSACSSPPGPSSSNWARPRLSPSSRRPATAIPRSSSTPRARPASRREPSSPTPT